MGRNKPLENRWPWYITGAQSLESRFQFTFMIFIKLFYCKWTCVVSERLLWVVKKM